MMQPPSPCCFYTIGHSNHTLEVFLAMLQAHGIETLVDVRSIPHSRFLPHFNQRTCAQALMQAGIRYHHLPALGGKRPDYRAYLDTEPFAAALSALLAIARYSRTALMCAEADPARCHRFLINNAAEMRGANVVHIRSASVATAHPVFDALPYTLELFA